MNIRRAVPCLGTFVTALACLLVSQNSHAAGVGTDRWTNSVSGLWRTPANWFSNAAPSTFYNAIFITNANSKTVTIDSATLATNLSVNTLTISAPPGTTNTLLIADVPTNTPFVAVNSLSLGRNSALRVTNSALVLSNTFYISNGIVTLDSGWIDANNAISIHVGRGSGTTGQLVQNGGSISTYRLQLGNTSGSQGFYTLNGGVFNSSSIVSMGESMNSTGTISIVSGQLIATNDFTKVGNIGRGFLTQSGGTSAFAYLSVGDNNVGTINMSGGTMSVFPRDTNDWTRIGNLNNAVVNISGGMVHLMGEVHVADGNGVSGTINMTGGSLFATNDLVAIGRYGTGLFTVSNATCAFTNTSVGRHAGSTGTLDIWNGASVFCYDDVSVGRFEEASVKAIGRVWLNGGLLSLTNDGIRVGRGGDGTLAVTNGTVRARGIYVAIADDPTNHPVGNVWLAGGTTILSSNLVIGTIGSSTGQVSVVGGTLNIGNSGASSFINVASGSFNLFSGTVTADNIFVTNAAGQLSITGGTMSAKNITVANGAPFVVGDGVNPASLLLQGGTYSFADGLVVNANASVTGCGTIVGSVSGAGTVSTSCGPVIKITSINKPGSTATVYFTTSNSLSHYLEFKNTLSDPTWTTINPPVIGNGGTMSQADTTATNNARCYRIRIQ